jgi:hypothetical protein
MRLPEVLILWSSQHNQQGKMTQLSHTSYVTDNLKVISNITTIFVLT